MGRLEAGRMRDADAGATRLPLLALPNRLLTVQEAADYLNVPVRWVQDAVQHRRVRCTRIGKQVRFSADHLLELIEAGEQPRTAAAATVAQLHRRRSRSRL
jgi:excisionase family DNA binding protein